MCTRKKCHLISFDFIWYDNDLLLHCSKLNNLTKYQSVSSTRTKKNGIQIKREKYKKNYYIIPTLLVSTSSKHTHHPCFVTLFFLLSLYSFRMQKNGPGKFPS